MGRITKRSEKTMTDCELLVFGVDGMSANYMREKREDQQTHFPNLRELEQQDRTEYGVMKSYICEGHNLPHTGPAWTSIYTGLKPEEHGLMSGGWKEGESEYHNMYTVWDKLSDTDTPVTLYGMPMTYRAKPIDTWMISGFVSTTLKSMFKYCYHPDNLDEDLPDNFLEYMSTYAAKRTIGGAAPKTDTEKGYNGLWEAEENRLETYRNLVEKRGTGKVAAYGTTFADKMGHIAGVEYGNRWTEKTYKKIDWMLGELIDILDPDDIVIISDHGYGYMAGPYNHDLQGYTLSTTGEIVGSLFDFAPWLLEQYGIDYNPDEYGPSENREDLTEEERDEIKGQLEKLGYLDNGD